MKKLLAIAAVVAVVVVVVKKFIGNDSNDLWSDATDEATR